MQTTVEFVARDTEPVLQYRHALSVFYVVYNLCISCSVVEYGFANDIKEALPISFNPQEPDLLLL